MIRRIVDFSLRQPLFVFLGTVIFAVAGVIAFQALPVEAFPDVSDTQMNIIALYPGRAAEEVEVNPDLAKMRDYKVTLAQLFTALSRANGNAGGGGVTQGRQQFLVRSLGSFRSSADIGQVVVAENKGTPLLVKDLADVRVGSAPPQGLAGQDEADDIVNGIVIMRKGENPSRVLEGLKEKIAYVNAQILPKGVEIVPYYDRSWLIDRKSTRLNSSHTVISHAVFCLTKKKLP